VTDYIQISWTDWAVRMIPVYTFVQPLVVVLAVYVLFGPFRTRKTPIPSELKPLPSVKLPDGPIRVFSWINIKVFSVIIGTCILWATDTWSSIPTAVTGITAVLILYAPYIGAIDFQKIGIIRWPLLLFIIGVLALGNALGSNSQMRSISGDALGWWIGLTNILFFRYYFVVLLMLPINWILGGVAGSALITPLLLANATKLQLDPTLLALCVIMGSVLVCMPYQSVAYMVAYSYHKATMRQYIYTLTCITFLNLIVIVPLTIGWWFVIGVA